MALNEEEKQLFNQLIDYAQYAGRLALIETTMTDGKRAAVVCIAVAQGDEINMHPIAQVITDDMFENYTPPEGSLSLET